MMLQSPYEKMRIISLVAVQKAMENLFDRSYDYQIIPDDYSLTNVEINGEYAIIKYVKTSDLPAFLLDVKGKSTVATALNDVEEQKIAEYMDTIINNDPFHKHAGKRLGDAMKEDPKWAEWCVQNLKNKFLCDRIKYLISKGVINGDNNN